MKIKQTTAGLDPYIKKYGCYFMSLANSVGKEFTTNDINMLWAKCIKLGHISGDMNNDGDFDDYNELLIMNPNGVCSVLGASYTYLNKHYDPTTIIPEGYYAIGCYFNPKNKFRHFVVIDKNKKVIYDPIPNSLTVKNGFLESIRLYKPV